ncbi:hypothetical protein [Nocardia carnea]|uniref:hypothetical protein n=1 Tax=Nocardia carnea TaxID=37328 RepID=UPI0024537879|nr:hypothetical protein [Nocardia carnea]
MTAADPAGPERFRFLATHVAGRSVAVAAAPAGAAADTDGAGGVAVLGVGGPGWGAGRLGATAYTAAGANGDVRGSAQLPGMSRGA